MSSILNTSLVRLGNDNYTTCGFVTLVNGSASVNITELGNARSDYKIFVSHYTVSQQSGRLWINIRNTPFVSFDIHSSEVSDTSVICWFVIQESSYGFNTALDFNKTCSTLLLKPPYNYGSIQLSGSEATVNTPFVKSNFPIILTVRTPSPTNQTPLAIYFISDVVDYTSFKIRSNQDNDTATISYLTLYPTENMNTIPGSLPAGDYTTFGLDASPSSAGNSGNYGIGIYSSINAPTTIYTTRASNSMTCFFANYSAPGINNFLYPPYLSSISAGQSFDVLQIDQQSFEDASFSWLLLP